MFEYIEYLSNKNELITKMTAMKEHFQQLSEFDIDVSDAISKIENAISGIQKDVLSIVLVGAFSDGKTSVVAGWLNEELDNMKIDTDESSDEILYYSPTSLPKDCQIVDTPGLFGEKVGNDDNGEKIVFSEITKKYISEANVILYVVPAKNPIKESHQSCIRWILKDLNKLSTVIFVINRMDDVVDLTDDEEFNLQKTIKTDALRTKLLDCGISPQAANKVHVVCVSAAPDGRKIEVWKTHRDEYLRRSRMTKLEDAVNEILNNSREVLLTKTGCNVLNDELNKVLVEISDQEHAIDGIVLPEKKESLKRNTKDLESLIKRIRQSREKLKDELKKLNKSKISKIRSASMETFKDMLEDEIGIVPEKEGAVLSEEIASIYNRYAEIYSGWSIEVGEKFQTEYDKQNKTIEAMLKMGASGASKGLIGAGKIGIASYKSAIFAGRELLGKIGIVIKFKPWQVVNMAKFAVKAVPFIGAAIDVVMNVVDNYSTFERNRKFEQNKEEIKNSVNELFIDCMDQVNDDKWFFENFAPDVQILKDQIAADEQDIAQMEENKNKYMAWSKKAKSIENCVF